MLGTPPSHAFAPQPERTGFEMTTHDLDHLRFADSVSGLDGFEGGPIFPGHLDDSANTRIFHKRQDTRWPVKKPRKMKVSSVAGV